jgi:glycosyltransferase involved in cell wall biosynthesis
MNSRKGHRRNYHFPPRKILFLVNVDWFFLSHRLPIAVEAKRLGFEVHVACTLTSQSTNLYKHGFQVHPLTLERGSSNPLNVFASFLEIYWLLRIQKPNLVHLVTIKPVLLGGIAARLVGVPSVVAAISGLGFVFVARGFIASLRRLLIAGLYRLAMGHTNLKVIFQNADDKASLQSLAHLAESKMALIRGSGVDLSEYKVGKPPPDERIVVLAARLLLDKGVSEFVDAARILRNHYGGAFPKVRFVLVGEQDSDNPRSVKTAQLKKWTEEGAIEHWGHRRDMPVVMSTAYIVTLPSYYGEGLPKVLVEAAACGRAVVTTDHPGCRDAIEPGVTGVLVPVRDARALANAIQDLLDHPDKCEAMGKAGRILAEQAFDVNQVVATHMQIYQELIAKAAQ